ncbi:hypothetical protein PPERSA_00710 [Pseudocohnilembus persalinus]|uniref:Uncharacterized protein n=1 Tax=Pseudocohnilembus persalinus TaxID=266149 RepID=A0A0V0QT94_PSEPJ|nr:hypothetical protein PPERSA_00710 [Pseudocohnilembus persalinus]|eukprot:KRX05409.1 hypothetical protein PPERSA_00710 [Pseudocohnilembus persalinus]
MELQKYFTNFFRKEGRRLLKVQSKKEQKQFLKEAFEEVNFKFSQNKDKNEKITIELTEQNIPTREIEKNRILQKGGVILRDDCKTDEFKLQKCSNILNHELF